jgi:hypothetical protein
MNGKLPGAVLSALAHAVEGRPEVRRASLEERRGERPTITLELEGAPDDLAEYRRYLQDLFAGLAIALGDEAHRVSFAAAPSESIPKRRREVVYTRAGS